MLKPSPKLTTVHVVTGRSESDDTYGPIVYATKPNEVILQALVRDWDFGDGDGPGYFGSYVYLTVTACEVRS